MASEKRCCHPPSPETESNDPARNYLGNLPVELKLPILRHLLVTSRRIRPQKHNNEILQMLWSVGFRTESERPKMPHARSPREWRRIPRDRHGLEPSILCVNREWNMLGVRILYGENTLNFTPWDKKDAMWNNNEAWNYFEPSEFHNKIHTTNALLVRRVFIGTPQSATCKRIWATEEVSRDP